VKSSNLFLILSWKLFQDYIFNPSVLLTCHNCWINRSILMELGASYHYITLLVYKYYWFTSHIPVIWWATIIFQRHSTISLFLEPRVNFLWCCHVMYHTVLYEYTQPLTHRKYPFSITLYGWRSAVFAAVIHTWHKNWMWSTHLITHTKDMLKANTPSTRSWPIDAVNDA